MWLITAAACLVLIGASSSAHARYDGPDKRLPDMILAELEVTDDSLAACRLKDGPPIEATQCAGWQRTLADTRSRIAAAEAKSEARDRAQAEAQAALEAEQQAKRTRPLSDIECFKSPACRESNEARGAEAQRRRDEEHRRDLAAQAAEEAAQARQDAVLKKACGKDYMTPRIGMPIKRALQCLGQFRMSGQVNRKDGVLTTYVNDDAMLQAIDGKLVGWVEY